jgi:hypothetical protein
MKPEHLVYIVLVSLVTMNAGCAGIKGSMPRFLELSGQQRSLTGSLDQLRAGKEQQARDLLEKVVDGAPTAGVTDEALFRLALLSLKEEGGKGLQRAQALLERLADKYPDSIWTRQSAPLLSHLAEDRVLRNQQRELKSLREQNLSLSRDNRELRQSLEQLKQLDLELEQRIKR